MTQLYQDIRADAVIGADHRHHAYAIVPDARFPGRVRRVEVAAMSYQESIHKAVEALLRKLAV